MYLCKPQQCAGHYSQSTHTSTTVLYIELYINFACMYTYTEYNTIFLELNVIHDEVCVHTCIHVCLSSILYHTNNIIYLFLSMQDLSSLSLQC